MLDCGNLSSHQILNCIWFLPQFPIFQTKCKNTYLIDFYHYRETKYSLKLSMSKKLPNPTTSITLPFENNNPSNIRLKYHSLLCKAINLDPRVRAGGWLYTLIREWTVINSYSISFSLFLDRCFKIILCHT